MSVTLAIDAMGGDHGVVVTVPAACDFLEKHSDVKITLVGDPDLIKQALSKSPKAPMERIHIISASEVVLMDDPIEVALRRKKDSSMRVAIEQVKEGVADAVISSGNTGALMAISRYILKTLEGVDRPAIATAIPNELGRGTTMLDLGANADCEPMHLVQFAQMANVMVQVVDGKQNPSIGLLNIGEEVIKENEVVKQTSELLRQTNLNFYGNVEGNDIFKGTTDVVVCDGFVGNVALKTAEGIAQLMGRFLTQEFKRNWITKLMAFVSLLVLNRFKKRLDPRRYNGASFLGLKGIVVKSHGGADSYSFFFAIQTAIEESKNNVLEKIQKQLELEMPLDISSSEHI